ncbi:glycosyltransferase family 2 protein [Pontibacter arcticus]|uniref:Glycosyltransferase 2-like domain-containing protein n=1 Tax=Pontibacter arcticus TaxID=2080288 RepID=A0A364RG92_9BACT|nr:glycosyltransferase [Pontibacter arcticus]RAU83287.1 hypothetical protein DP923_08755 [Pontibacter arcticus]
MSFPLVSVIIPVYNSAQFLEQMLKSVFKQTYNNFEVICVDNNSKDNSVDIIKSLKVQHNWDIKILTENRQGAPYARNSGLSIAKGDYVQFLDSDDFLINSKLEKQVNFFQQNHEIDFITAENFAIINGEKRYSKRDFKDTWQGLITGSIGITSSALFKKEALENVGGFNILLNSNQEKDLIFRLLVKGYKHAQLNEPLFEKNVHDQSISNTTMRKDRQSNLIIFLGKIKQHLLEQNNFKQYEKLLTTRFFYLLEELYLNAGFIETKKMYHSEGRYNIWKGDFSLFKKIAIQVLNPVNFWALYYKFKH